MHLNLTNGYLIDMTAGGRYPVFIIAQGNQQVEILK